MAIPHFRSATFTDHDFGEAPKLRNGDNEDYGMDRSFKNNSFFIPKAWPAKQVGYFKLMFWLGRRSNAQLHDSQRDRIHHPIILSSPSA